MGCCLMRHSEPSAKARNAISWCIFEWRRIIPPRYTWICWWWSLMVSGCSSIQLVSMVPSLAKLRFTLVKMRLEIRWLRWHQYPASAVPVAINANDSPIPESNRDLEMDIVKSSFWRELVRLAIVISVCSRLDCWKWNLYMPILDTRGVALHWNALASPGERSVAYGLPHRCFKYNVKDGERHCAAKVFLL